MATTPVRSRKVRKILRLEARARRLLTRYERALNRAVPSAFVVFFSPAVDGVTLNGAYAAAI